MEFTHATETPPRRIAVIGAGGFIGGAIARAAERRGLPLLRLGRPDLDLLQPGAEDRLAAMLQPDDAVVMVSAQAPCKDAEMLQANIRMAAQAAAALRRAKPDHLLYISSDAVYADSPDPLTEFSCAAPASLHGVMHLAREIMLRDAVGGAAFATLRPTLVYGPGDPHNGYGPNRFWRNAAAGEPIALFGNGEERRDHIHVEDVAALALGILLRRGIGILNAATGMVTSFHDIAEMVRAHHPGAPPIRTLPRSGPMPHGGYRPFDIAAMRQAFPALTPTRLRDGLAGLPKRHGG